MTRGEPRPVRVRWSSSTSLSPTASASRKRRPAPGGSSISESTRLVLRSDDDSIIDLTVVIPTVEMVESAARE